MVFITSSILLFSIFFHVGVNQKITRTVPYVSFLLPFYFYNELFSNNLYLQRWIECKVCFLYISCLEKHRIFCWLPAGVVNRMLDPMRELGIGKDLVIFFSFAIYIMAVFLCDGHWIETMFVSAASLFLIIFACEDDLLSKILSSSIVKALSNVKFNF